MEVKTSSSFKTTGLLHPLANVVQDTFQNAWTTRVTGWVSPHCMIMHMLYCFVNNNFMWIMWSWRHKDKVGMQIPNWIITKEMNTTTGAFIGSERVKCSKNNLTMIRFRTLPKRDLYVYNLNNSSANVDKADEMILQDTLQVSLAGDKSQEEQKLRKMLWNWSKALGTSPLPQRDQDDPPCDAHPEVENSAKRRSKVSHDIMERGLWLLMIDRLKVNVPDEIRRQRCYFTKGGGGCQSDPEAPLLSLIEIKTVVLKKGSSRPEKDVLSLHKFPAIIFNDDDIEERTSRWVNKKNKKRPGKPKEVIYFYSNSKIIQVIKTYWELGHEHKFITEIVARRANECIVSITEPDYKNLNKNDIEDMYLLIMNGKVPDYAETGLLWSLSVFIRSSVIWERVHDFQLGIESYQQKVNLTAPTISFPGVEKHKMFSIIYEPVHGIIYKNSKKEKRVMRHSEIHKFCDATLIRVLEGLKSYNNDVKYGYVQRELTNDEVEYLKLFEEEIEVRLKYRNQMRRWEMYVNGRPLGPRRERPE
ncbi:hypothetical protein Tco_0693853 [Tanacetum coccineum]